jgi:hypothetical protein
MSGMSAFPEFFAVAPVITIRDPLAEFLGAASNGCMEYRYADVVKLAGHSCPTVAAAFLMIRAGLAALHPGELPVRGGLRVALREGAQAGTTGVVANVAAFITGAAQDGGFKGIGGHFDRRNLLAFKVPMSGELRISRVDTGAAVEVSAELASVPMEARVRELLLRCLADRAEPREVDEFRRLWQDRVRRLLLEHADDPAVIRLGSIRRIAR